MIFLLQNAQLLNHAAKSVQRMRKISFYHPAFRGFAGEISHASPDIFLRICLFSEQRNLVNKIFHSGCRNKKIVCCSKKTCKFLNQVV
jgi:hypothetical protein